MPILGEEYPFYSMHGVSESSNYRPLEGCRRQPPPLRFVFKSEFDPRLYSMQLLGRLGLGYRLKCQNVKLLHLLSLEGFKLGPVVLSAKGDIGRQNGIVAQGKSQLRGTTPQVVQQGLRGVRSIKAQFYQPILPGDFHWFLIQFLLLLHATLGDKSDIRYSYRIDPVTSTWDCSCYGVI